MTILVGSSCIDRYGGYSCPNATLIDLVHTIPINGVITSWCLFAKVGIEHGTESPFNAKLKVFRDNGVNYEFVGESSSLSLVYGLNNNLSANINVQTGDIIGVWFNCTGPSWDNGTANPYGIQYSEISSTTPKGDWLILSNNAFSFQAQVEPPSVANITIQDITIGGTSCIAGCYVTCTANCPAIVDIVITWANSGDSSGTFTPTITIDEGLPISEVQITIGPSGGIGTTTFSGVSLPQGILKVCLDTGVIT